MERKAFYEAVKEAAKAKFETRGEMVEITIERVDKVNNTGYTALAVKPSLKDGNTAACIDLDVMYDLYSDGNTLDEIVDKAIDEYAKAMIPPFDSDVLMDFERIKENLSVYLAETRKNEDWLEDKVFSPCLDLSEIVCLTINEDSVSCTATVTKRMAEMWGKSTEEIMAEAKKNLAKQEYVFASIFHFLGFRDTEASETDGGLMVLSNKSGELGAALITREDIQKEICERYGSSYYVIPSSVHEVLILPETYNVSTSLIKRMISEVNETEVSDRDRLSDSLYFYDKAKGTLELVE